MRFEYCYNNIELVYAAVVHMRDESVLSGVPARASSAQIEIVHKRANFECCMSLGKTRRIKAGFRLQ
jgi:hypothetical protein